MVKMTKNDWMTLIGTILFILGVMWLTRNQPSTPGEQNCSYSVQSLC